MKLTKLVVERLSIPLAIDSRATTQKRYYDDDSLKGFGIRVTSGGTKAFFLEKLVAHKLTRTTIDCYPEITVEKARKEAHKLLEKIATGIDPIAEKREIRLKAITLKEAFADYVKVRKNPNPRTIQDYECVLNQAVSDWINKPLISITKDMISRRHASYGEKSKARANLIMRLLRAIFNFAAGQYEDTKGESAYSRKSCKATVPYTRLVSY